MATQKTVTAKYNGLVNLGATCYLNSVLQVLFMTEDFRERVKRNNAGEEHIDKELRDLFRDLEEHVTYTYKLTTKLKIKNVHEQRDAAEHYEKILRLTSPEASQIFHGELLNTNTCKKCNTKSESPAGFWQLPLPLVDNNNEYSVEKGIEDFFCQSEISGEDQMYCETCDEKCDAVLDCVVKHYPEVLVLLLKRFKLVFDGKAVRKVKINCPVKMPDTLHMKKTYKLYAFVDHFGELQSGHYMARIKPQDDEQWYIFDDQNVQVSSYKHFQLDPTETSNYVYLLFYRRQKKDTAFANMDTRDASEISPATSPCNRTEEEHSFSEKNEEDKTQSKDFKKKFLTKDQPARPKIKVEKKRPGRDNVNNYSRDEENEAKKLKISKSGQDRYHKKSHENLSVYDVNKHSTFHNYTDSVKIEMPGDTYVKTSKNTKTSQNLHPEDTKYVDARAESSYGDSNVKIEKPGDTYVKPGKNNKTSQNLHPEDTKYIEARGETLYGDSNVKIEIPGDTQVKTSKNNETSRNPEEAKYIDARAKRSYGDSNVNNAKFLSGMSTQVNSVDPQYDGGQWEDQAMTRRQQLRQAQYSSDEFSQSNATRGKQHVRQHDTGIAEYTKQDVQRFCKQVQPTHSVDPGQSRRHDNPGTPMSRRDQGQGGTKSETVERHNSSHGSGKYYSQDLQLENFRKGIQVPVYKMTNVGADVQNYNNIKDVARVSEEEAHYNGPSVQKPQQDVPRQYLERSNQKTTRSSYNQPSQRVNSARGGGHSSARGGDGECKSMETKIKTYSKQNAKLSDNVRNKSHQNMTSPEAEITPDSLAEKMKCLTINESPKTEEDPQTFIKAEGEVVETNRHKSRMCKCFCTCFGRKHSK